MLLAAVPYKQCSACRQTKPLDDFYQRKGKCRVCVKAYVTQYKRDNPEKVRRWVAAYDRRHPEKTRARIARSAQRRQSASGGAFDPEREDYKQRWAYYGGRCAYCGDPATALDHVVPLVRGGSNFASNIRPACKRCNSSKGTKKLSEWPGPRVPPNKPG